MKVPKISISIRATRGFNPVLKFRGENKYTYIYIENFNNKKNNKWGIERKMYI